MDDFVDSIVDFIRLRQLNIAVAALFTLAYLVYQYRGLVFKGFGDDELSPRPSRLSRSRSRSRSKSRSKQSHHYDYKIGDSKHRRGRKPTRRCPDCSLCNFED